MNLLERVFTDKADREITELRDAVHSIGAEREFFQERIADLELALEDADWTRLLMTSKTEFSRDGLGRIVDIARLMYIKNPIINRGVNLKRLYVWGNGLNISADDDDINQVIQDFLDDSHNQAELTGHQAQTLKEVDLESDGNIFFVFFTDISTGKVVVRSIPFDEITEIICNPDDAKEPWYYHRVWSSMDTEGKQTTHDEYYPDWNLSNEARWMPSGGTINKDMPIFHVKIGGFSSWKFGLSEVYAAIDWAKAYKNFLENWATISQALARFAWKVSTTAGKAGVAAIKSKLNTTLGTTSGDTNPPSTTGSTFIEGSAKLDPIKTAGAQTSAEEGRRVLLMACAALGTPETFYGDASVGTLATAKSLDRPTELMMLDRQMLWSDVFRRIIDFVMKANIRAGGILSAIATIDENGNIAWNEDIDKSVHIEFPPLMTNDKTAEVDAIFKAWQTQTLDDETVVRLLLDALGISEPDEILKKLFPPEEEQPEASPETVTEALNAFTEGVREFFGTRA